MAVNDYNNVKKFNVSGERKKRRTQANANGELTYARAA